MVAHHCQPAEMNLYRNASDRQRFSTESSRASVSSSRSSSFSSVDFYRGTQSDPAHNDSINFSKAVFENSHSRSSSRIAQQSADFRDVVKDSMVREARGSSLNKTTTREENTSCGLKQRYTLRGSMLFKTVDGDRSKGNQLVRGNLKDSIDVPSKLQGAEWPYNEAKEQRRLSDYGYSFEDASRKSYDGMETSRLSFDQEETFSASKLRDSPRLLVDGRESATRKVRSPSVIAKLMGLTAMPDSSSSSTQIDGSFIRTRNAQAGLDATDTRKSMKEPASPRPVTSDMKPISSSRIPVEQAPWKYQEKDATLVKLSSTRIRSPTRQSNPIPSVYSEIEKRFKDIEFNQSGKDLRALKQILQLIHAKGLLEDKKQELTFIKAKPKSVSQYQKNARGEQLTKAISDHEKSFMPSDTQLQILIKKPAGRSPRCRTSTTMHSDHVVGSNKKCNSTQHSSKLHVQPKDNSASSPRILGSTSPRTRLKKLPSKQQTESSSPGQKVLPRLANKQENGNQISEIPFEIKKMRSQTNEAPLPSEGNTGFNSKRDKEVTRSTRSNKVDGSNSLSRRASKEVVLASKKASNHISLTVKHEETVPEHPSPVSVLNMSQLYTDDSSTEEKLISTPLEEFAEGYDPLKLLSIDSLVQKLEQLNSNHDESRKDCIAMLCDDTANPDHRYISEILLASGLLLREFCSDHAQPFQLHSSGFLINPELFNVLEQTKFSAKADESNFHRKLIFDTVNELLTKKLTSNGKLTDYTVKRLAKKSFNTQNLIKEVCAEIEQLKNQENNIEKEDESDAVNNLLRYEVMKSDKWNVFEGGISEVLLDIERSLFKNLVNEIVISDYRFVRPMSGTTSSC